MTTRSGIALYRATAREASAPVIRRYSSSFGLATALFPRRCRAAVGTIYALVRIADEIVDGTAGEAGLDPAMQRCILDELEADTERAMRTGFSANLVVQAFGDVARRCGIRTELTRPFFASMRRDLEPVDFDADELRRYVHGSAEVIGLMCLRVFLADRLSSPHDAELHAPAAALGAAFQKINFLRDLADDRGRLDRRYLPGFGTLPADAAKSELVAEIRAELALARSGIRRLPPDCRLAVATATAVFGELLEQLDALPAEALLSQRVSVPGRRKLALLARERVLLMGVAR